MKNQESHSPTFNLAAPFSHANLQAARFAAAQSGSHSLSDIQSVPVNRSMGEIMLDLILPRAEASPVLIPVAAEIVTAAGKAGAFVAGALGVGTLAAVAAPHFKHMAKAARESVERGVFLTHSEEPRPCLGPRPEDRHKQPPLTFVNENRNEDPLVFPAHSSQNSEGKYVSPIMALPGVLFMYKQQGKEEAPCSTDNKDTQIALNKKLSALENAQKKAVRVEKLTDERIRYYGPERPAKKTGNTRGASLVTEYNPKTGQVRMWNEAYDQAGNVNRVHPKMIDGIELTSQHYPATKAELGALNQKLKGPK